jgi:hypothetical protein
MIGWGCTTTSVAHSVEQRFAADPTAPRTARVGQPLVGRCIRLVVLIGGMAVPRVRSAMTPSCAVGSRTSSRPCRTSSRARREHSFGGDARAALRDPTQRLGSILETASALRMIDNLL